MTVDIDRLSEQVRQWRIERGLSPEPKRIEPFVEVPLSMAIMDRMQPFVRIAIKYAALLADGVIHRIDTGKFAEYREYAELLNFSRGFWCRYAGALGVYTMLNVMDAVNEASDEDIHLPDVLQTAHFAIEMMRHDVRMDAWDDKYPLPNEKERAFIAEYNHLRFDNGAFTAALEEARRQYELIKGDIDNYECE